MRLLARIAWWLPEIVVGAAIFYLLARPPRWG